MPASGAVRIDETDATDDRPLPKIEPFDHGMLQVGDGNLMYWEVGGNPDGKPAVVLHGGPGSGCSHGARRFFDPAAYRIVLYDQRGWGRSRPHASDTTVDLASNTTDHLIADIEGLRKHLGIERWLVFDGSWGSTLGLAYTERFAERVSEMVMASVVTTSRREVQWYSRGRPVLPRTVGPIPGRSARGRPRRRSRRGLLPPAK